MSETPDWKYKIWECHACGEAENFNNPCIWKNPLNSDEPGFCPLGGDECEWVESNHNQ